MSAIEPPLEYADEAELKAAREMYVTDERLAIDDNAQTSRADDGVWVQAWVWLDNDEIERAEGFEPADGDDVDPADPVADPTTNRYDT